MVNLDLFIFSSPEDQSANESKTENEAAEDHAKWYQRRKKNQEEGGWRLWRLDAEEISFITSPTLRSLNDTTWSQGRGKGGKKLGVGGGLIKNLPEKGFKEWTKMVKLSNQNLIKKRKEDSLNSSLNNSYHNFAEE